MSGRDSLTVRPDSALRRAQLGAESSHQRAWMRPNAESLVFPQTGVPITSHARAEASIDVRRHTLRSGE